MNNFFVSYQAYKDSRLVGLGEYIVYCSCGLEGIRKSLLDHFNTNAKRFGDYEANNIVITSLAVLDQLSAMQLSSDTCNVIKIEDKYNSTKEQ